MKQYVSIAGVVFEFDCPVEITAFKTMYGDFLCAPQEPGVKFRFTPYNGVPATMENAAPVEKEGNVFVFRSATHTIRVQSLSFHNEASVTAYLVRENGDIMNYEVFLPQQHMAKYTASLHFLNLIALEEVLLNRGKISLHGVFLKDGGAYVFTAPSGTGKTTISNHWVNAFPTSEVINGDCTVLGEENGVFYAYSVPFCGSSRIHKNEKVPLKAIIRVCRGEKNEVQDLSFSQKFTFLYEGITVNRWDDAAITKNADVITNLLSSCKMIAYRCINDPSAAKDLKAYFE